MTTPPALVGRVLAILARDVARTDAELATELGVTLAELSAVIGRLYRQRRADRCAGYLVAVPLPPGGLEPAASSRPLATTQETVMTPPAAPADHDRAALLAAALACAARGWPVFPLRPGDKQPAFPDHTAGRCTGRDPRCRAGHVGWEPRATTDPGRIRRAWAQAAWNVGIATGPAGLLVIDLDRPKPGQAPPPAWAQPGITDGADALAALCERYGQPWPGDTFTVRTRRGGLHLYFTAPPGARLGNTAGRSQRGLGWLIDTRGQGGCVVAAGSLVDLPDGAGRYQVVHDQALAPLPGWLAALLAPPSRDTPSVECPQPSAAVGDLAAYAAAALRSEVQRVVSSPDHGHNWALNKAAYNLGRRIAVGALDRGLAEHALQAAGEAAHTCETPARIAAVIRAGIDAGIRTATPADTRKGAAA